MKKHKVSPYKYNERKLYLSMGVVSYWIFISFVFTNLASLVAPIQNIPVAQRMEMLKTKEELKGVNVNGVLGKVV